MRPRLAAVPAFQDVGSRFPDKGVKRLLVLKTVAVPAGDEQDLLGQIFRVMVGTCFCLSDTEESFRHLLTLSIIDPGCHFHSPFPVFWKLPSE